MNVSAPLLLLLLLAACVVSGGLLPRALWQLSSTIMCHQPGVNPFRYIDYGCWCGLRSKGPPQDDVDLCCKVHDNCYERSSKTPGCTAIADLPVVIVYDYTCSDQQVTCSATNNKCQAAACECDQAAARCFAQAKYNPEYKNLDPKVHCVE